MDWPADQAIDCETGAGEWRKPWNRKRKWIEQTNWWPRKRFWIANLHRHIYIHICALADQRHAQAFTDIFHKLYTEYIPPCLSIHNWNDNIGKGLWKEKNGASDIYIYMYFPAKPKYWWCCYMDHGEQGAYGESAGMVRWTSIGDSMPLEDMNDLLFLFLFWQFFTKNCLIQHDVHVEWVFAFIVCLFICWPLFSKNGRIQHFVHVEWVKVWCVETHDRATFYAGAFVLMLYIYAFSFLWVHPYSKESLPCGTGKCTYIVRIEQSHAPECLSLFFGSF